MWRSRDLQQQEANPVPDTPRTLACWGNTYVGNNTYTPEYTQKHWKTLQKQGMGYNHRYTE